MEFEKLWNKIIFNIKNSPREIQTIPILKNKIGVWFYVYSQNDEIYISGATKNFPVSSIKKHTRISKESFEKTYPIYLRRCNGEKVAHDAQKVSRFQVYIYSILKNYGEI